uniref:Arabidopsis retrotransposon Orf1 C-terminal domain-containing protein n=2 Tax=Chenopodium quinoa TaxID=63459 RepID=A0A803LA75_CHEQI
DRSRSCGFFTWDTDTENPSEEEFSEESIACLMEKIVDNNLKLIKFQENMKELKLMIRGYLDVKELNLSLLSEQEPSKEVVEEAGASEKEVDNSRVEDESKEAPPKPLASYVPKVDVLDELQGEQLPLNQKDDALEQVLIGKEDDDGNWESREYVRLLEEAKADPSVNPIRETLNVLGLPNEGPRLTSKYWSADPIWRTLTDDREYDSNNSPGNHIRHPALRYVQRLLSCTVFGRYEGGKARKDELFMLDRMLHGQPINTGAFLIKQMRDLANKTTTSGAIVLGGLITPIALYLGHKERLVTEESIGGVDALDISACALMNWIVKKDGTTLWCIKGNEDVLPPAENMSLRVEGNWSFGKVEPLACVSIPHEPLSPPPMTEVPTPAPIEGTLNILLTSVDEIKTEQKEIKEQLKSMSTFLATLSTWIQSGGVANPPYFFP